MADSGVLEGAAESLTEALQAHTRAVLSSDVSAIDAAAAAVRASARSYEDAVFERCGAGSVFQDRSEIGHAEEGWEIDEEPYAPPAGAARISITGRWDFTVTDSKALHVAARGTAAEEKTGSAPRNAAADLEAIAVTLFVGVAGLEVAGSGWSVTPISKTLFEMSEGERDSTGF